jgi:hypothetical protein
VVGFRQLPVMKDDLLVSLDLIDAIADEFGNHG